jgi:2-polyprenyl-3-methyl-5-hydroxy-6-metoxy-1,4-benzoquinol methylase
MWRDKSVIGFPSLEKQEQYWDFWQDTRSENTWTKRRSEAILAIVESLKLREGKILDLGCGTGWFTEALAQYGEATGIDLSKNAMTAAAKRWSHIRFLAGDLFEYPLESGYFDVVVSVGVIAHVRDQDKFLRRVATLLKPGGYLVLATINRFVLGRMGGAAWGSHESLGHLEHWLSKGELRRLASRYFEIDKLTTLVPVGNGGILRLVNSVRLNKALQVLVSERRLVHLKEQLNLGYYRLLVARKTERAGR